MKDPRYQYDVAVSAQIIVYDSKKQILLAKRPSNWEWMPGRWGLVGGKLYEDEGFVDTIKRKTKQEYGVSLKPDGLYRVYQLLIKNRQAHMFILVKKHMDKISPTGEMAEYRWFTLKELNRMKLEDFAEYYYKELLIEFINSKKVDLLPLDFISTLKYFELESNQRYKNWFAGGINKSYNPEDIKDFKKWKRKKV